MEATGFSTDATGIHIAVSTTTSEDDGTGIVGEDDQRRAARRVLCSGGNARRFRCWRPTENIVHLAKPQIAGRAGWAPCT
jgi:hypothetical protein